jgi:hypothetical protein
VKTRNHFKKRGVTKKTLRVEHLNKIMKSLIKLSIVALFLAMGTESFAQTFGVRAGLNLSDMYVMLDDVTYSDDSKMYPGFHIGPTMELPINEMFTFETALLLSTKGFKMSEKESFNGDTYETKIKLNRLYLDIPLTAKASFDVGSVKIFGTFGPYIGIPLSRKAKYEYTYHSVTETEEGNIDFGSNKDEDDFKRLDFGLTASLGVELNSIQISINYGLGLANISPYNHEGNKENNRVLGVSVEYKFGKK